MHHSHDACGNMSTLNCTTVQHSARHTAHKVPYTMYGQPRPAAPAETPGRMLRPHSPHSQNPMTLNFACHTINTISATADDNAVSFVEDCTLPAVVAEHCRHAFQIQYYWYYSPIHNWCQPAALVLSVHNSRLPFHVITSCCPLSPRPWVHHG